MSRKKTDKKISCLKVSFGNVLVCEKNNHKPFLEDFVQEPENLAQQNLGTLAGIFEIDDRSEDSSYIVNYLISIIKKEYYSRTKRGPIESFEAALHKANLALAKLAEHGNIGWIGKINAILLVIEKNNIHLSQTGEAHAFLLRSRILTNITENLAQEKAANPLKTFTDVVSGRLENGDKLIIAEQNIFNVFSLEEIKRSALKFSSSDFIRFLKTALVNELEYSAVLVADVLEKVETVPEQPSPKNQSINAFSQAAFAKTPAPAKKHEGGIEKNINSEEKKVIIGEIQDEIKKEKGEFVDKKTGHIYIKEDQFLKKDKSYLSEFIENGQTKIANFSLLIVNFLKAKIVQKISFSAIFREIFNGLKKIFIFGFRLVSSLKPAVYRLKTQLPRTKNADSETSPDSYFRSRLQNISQSARPSWTRIKNTFINLNYQQKLYAVLALMLVIFVPYFAIKTFNKNKEKENVPQEIIATISIPLEQDKNVVRIENLSEIYSGNEISETINLNDKIFTIGASEIINLENKEAYPVPDDFKPVKISAGMDDLNLIILIGQNNKAVSWSPASKKFQENQISLPENNSLVSAKTYLTYLYLLDTANGQIYRYPRAEGGFGAPANWLKENIDLSAIKDMAVSDNVYLAEENNLIKFYRGKKQDFQAENSTTAFNFDKVYAKKDSQNIYFLDKANSRIVKLDLNGNIISQFYNPEISNAQSFTADETANLIYFNTPSSVKSFGM